MPSMEQVKKQLIWEISLEKGLEEKDLECRVFKNGSSATVTIVTKKNPIAVAKWNLTRGRSVRVM